MNQSNIDWILPSFCGVDMDHVLIVCATMDTTPLTIDPHRVVLFGGCYSIPKELLQFGIYRFFLIQFLPQLLDRMVISLEEEYCVG